VYHDFRAFDPSKYLDEVSPGRTATVVVATVGSSLQARAQADFLCGGVNDHIEIQAALDALPATGGEVHLLEGTYNVETTINLDSNQTLRGCGRNTILATATANLIFLTAVGASGSEKTGIVIADLQIDGGTISARGVRFEYVDYSLIQNVYSRRNADTGILLENSDFNTIEGNTCQENTGGLSNDGIRLHVSNNNTIIGNTCQGNGYGIRLRDSNSNNTVTGNTCIGNTDGIQLYGSSNNTITGNTCQGNGAVGINLTASSDNNTVTGNTCNGNSSHGITVTDSDNNTISGNTCQGNYNGINLTTSCIKNTISGNTCQGNTRRGITLYNSCDNNLISENNCQDNGWDGIYINTCDGNTITSNICQGNGLRGIGIEECNNGAIIGNICTENSQDADNTYDDIYLEESDYNDIQANTCRAGALTNKPQYGINISTNTCDGNLVTNNDLYNDGFGTAPFHDIGDATKLNVYVVPFVDGTDPQDSGFLINGAGDMARAWLRLPDKVVQVVRMRVYGRSAQGFNVPPMTADFAIYGGAHSEQYNTHDGSVADKGDGTYIAADDILSWLLTEAGVLALKGGDSVEVKVVYSATAIATNAYFRTVEIEYV